MPNLQSRAPFNTRQGAAWLIKVKMRGPDRADREVHGHDLTRIADGWIVESWVNYDALALLQQVGLVPPVKGM